MTVDDVADLLRLVRDRPEWRDELRRALLTDELLALPERFAAMVERVDTLAQRVDDLTQSVNALAQRVDDLTLRLDTLAQRVDDLTQRLDTLAQRVDDLTQRLDTLAQRVDDLTQRLDTLAQRVDDLTQRVDGLAQRLDELAQQTGQLVKQVGRLTDHVDWLRGDALERRYRERAFAYFQSIARRIRLLPNHELDEILEGLVGDGALTSAEAQEVRLSDGVFTARRADEQVYLVLEASWVIDRDDVVRAKARADVMAKAGRPAIAVVAGDWLPEEVARAAAGMRVWAVTDGTVLEPVSG